MTNNRVKLSIGRRWRILQQLQMPFEVACLDGSEEDLDEPGKLSATNLVYSAEILEVQPHCAR